MSRDSGPTLTVIGGKDLQLVDDGDPTTIDDEGLQDLRDGFENTVILKRQGQATYPAVLYFNEGTLEELATKVNEFVRYMSLSGELEIQPDGISTAQLQIDETWTCRVVGWATETITDDPN